MDRSFSSLAHKLKGREMLMIPLATILFCLTGSTGMLQIETSKNICEMHSEKVEIKCTKGLPSVYNNFEICKIVKDAAVEAVGQRT